MTESLILQPARPAPQTHWSSLRAPTQPGCAHVEAGVQILGPKVRRPRDHAGHLRLGSRTGPEPWRILLLGDRTQQSTRGQGNHRDPAGPKTKGRGGVHMGAHRHAWPVVTCLSAVFIHVLIHVRVCVHNQQLCTVSGDTAHAPAWKQPCASVNPLAPPTDAQPSCPSLQTLPLSGQGGSRCGARSLSPMSVTVSHTALPHLHSRSQSPSQPQQSWQPSAHSPTISLADFLQACKSQSTPPATTLPASGSLLQLPVHQIPEPRTRSGPASQRLSLRLYHDLSPSLIPYGSASLETYVFSQHIVI